MTALLRRALFGSHKDNLDRARGNNTTRQPTYITYPHYQDLTRAPRVRPVPLPPATSPPRAQARRLSHPLQSAVQDTATTRTHTIAAPQAPTPHAHDPNPSALPLGQWQWAYIPATHAPLPQSQQQSSYAATPTHSPHVTWASPVAQTPATTKADPGISHAHQSVTSGPACAGQGQARATSDVDPAILAAIGSGEGSLLIDKEVTFKHSVGVCAVSVMSTWEASKRLIVNTPITINEFYNALRRAGPTLERAYFKRIVPDSGVNRNHWKGIEATRLQVLIIGSTDVPLGGVLRDLKVRELLYLSVGYGSDCAQNLWADEQEYYRFLQRAQLAREGNIIINAGDPWYRENRAEHLIHWLRAALGSARERNWSVYVPRQL